jgi:hypothetical protein
MILGILLVMLVMVSGCIVAATPDPSLPIQASIGDTLDFQVFGVVGTANTPTHRIRWEVAEWACPSPSVYSCETAPLRFYEERVDYFRSDTFHLTINPEDETINRITVRAWAEWLGVSSPINPSCSPDDPCPWWYSGFPNDPFYNKYWEITIK